MMLKRSKLKDDERGVIDLPMKLLVMIILIGTAIPAGLIGYRNINRIQFENKVNRELNYLISTSKRLAQEGNLSSMSIELDLDGSLFADLDHVSVGDELGGEDWVIEYHVSWRTGGTSLFALDPIVHLTSRKNSTLRLEGHSYKLRLTHVVKGENSFIVVMKNGYEIDYSNF